MTKVRIISEDTKVIYQILVDKQKYGIISDALYNYRRRMEETNGSIIRPFILAGANIQ